MLEQAARGPNSMVGPANCFATRYGCSRIWIQPKRCSLTSASLRPNCPVCGPAKGAGASWSQAGAWVAEEPIVVSEISPVPNRQVRRRIEKGCRVAEPYMQAGNIGSANKRLQRTADAAR